MKLSDFDHEIRYGGFVIRDQAMVDHLLDLHWTMWADGGVLNNIIEVSVSV